MDVGIGAFAPVQGYVPPAAGAAFTALSPQAPQAGEAPAAPGAPDAVRQSRATAKMMNDRFIQDCQTCKNRKYQDGSNDSGVSFQTPTHISPGASAAMVRGHEREHVTRNAAKARREGGEVLSSTVTLHGGLCPECGRYYIAGGVTRTVTRSGGEEARGGHPHPEQSGGSLNIGV